MTRILNKWWYTTFDGHIIGIVQTIDDFTKEEKFRIGVAYGLNEEQDADRISKMGDRFFPNMIK